MFMFANLDVSVTNFYSRGENFGEVREGLFITNISPRVPVFLFVVLFNRGVWIRPVRKYYSTRGSISEVNIVIEVSDPY